MMVNLNFFDTRWTRHAVAWGALAAYVLLIAELTRVEALRDIFSAALPLLGVWALGMLLLTVWEGLWRRIRRESLVMMRCLWANIGILAVAVMVEPQLRMLLMVLPLLCIFYAALHLERQQIVLVGLFSWLCYALLDLAKLSMERNEWQWSALATELASMIVFALLLAAGLLICWELLRARESLQSRNRGLRETLGRLQELALRDELTGVHNRRFILDVLARQKALADRTQQAFTVCYCDLDHFKRINDQHGHKVGDEALRRFARLAAATVRNVDYVARMGGEEFVLVLVDAEAPVAAQVAQRLCERTRELRIKGVGQAASMSVSVGVTQYQSTERIDDLLARADHALYEAKQNGRDGIVVS